jgi:mercuric ion binding protein
MKLLASAAAVALLTAAPALAAEQTVTLVVENMTCALCGPTVKKALTRVDGVGKVEVSTDKGTATVSFDDAKTTVEALTAATAKAGYPSWPTN